MCYSAKQKIGEFIGKNAIVVYVRQKIISKEMQPKTQLIEGTFEAFFNDMFEPFGQDRLLKHLDCIGGFHRSREPAVLDVVLFNSVY